MPPSVVHKFPPFYACYLLRSVQTPNSQSTYIGSTPNPPRRIRQHNGELSQGASKTKHKRPWVMQMIVYGFPSRLAALQFEWAWQHPHLSRHLRNSDGETLFAKTRKLKLLGWSIQTVRTMICLHPYNTWPLHVKLFTKDAVKHWEHAGNVPPLSPLPCGFTCQVELEGIDGKSGSVGSGRKGPIDITDSEFTRTILAKNVALVDSGEKLRCSICDEHLDDYVTDPRATVLCTAPSCTAVSHTICLSRYFLDGGSGIQTKAIIPRGGNCKTCGSYTLWGDLMRGSSRRSTIDQNKSDETATNEDARSKGKGKGKGKKALGASRVAKIETFDIADESNSTEDESSTLEEEIPAKVIYPLQVVKSRKAAARSTINPTQLARAMSNLAIKSQDYDVIEISD